jgi:O-antigen/teichoic acid export membrane protein
LKALLLKSISGKLINSIIGLLIISLLPILVGSEEYGKYIVIWGMVVLIGQLSALGLPIMYVRMGVDYLTLKSTKMVLRSNYFSLLNLLISLPIFFVVVFLFSDNLNLYMHDYLLIFTSAGILFVFRLVNGYNRGCGEVLYSQIIDVALRGLILIAVSLFIYYGLISEFNERWQSPLIFISLCLSIFLATLVAKENGFKFLFDHSNFSKNWRSQYTRSVMIFSGSDIRKVEEQLMYVFVGANIGFTEVAILVIAARINDIVLFFVSSANYAFIPKIRLFYKQKNTDFNKAIVFFFLVTVGSLLLFMPVYYNLDDIVLWHYGQGYESIALYTLIYLISIFFSSLIGPAQNIATIVDLEKIVFKVNIILTPLTVLGMYFSSINLGVMYVLFSLLLGRFIGQFWVAMYLFKKERVNLFPISNALYLFRKYKTKL